MKDVRELKVHVMQFLKKTGESAQSSTEMQQLVVVWGMRFMSLLGWAREQWSLWGLLLTIAAAYFFPIVTASELVVSVCVAIVFLLHGASISLTDLWNTLNKSFSAFVLCVFLSFVVAPLVALVAYSLPLGLESGDTHMAWISGIIFTFSLPPSSISSIVATTTASGNEALALCFSTIGNVLGMIVSPLLIQALVPSNKLYHLRSSRAFMLRLAFTILLPFFLGQLLQAVVNWAAKSSRGQEDSKRSSHVAAATVMCVDPIELQSNFVWRSRMRYVSYIVSMFLNYAVFAGLFHVSHVPGENKIPDLLGGIALVELSLHLVLCCAAWGLSSLLPMTPEDRIACFYASVQKSEILAAPLLSQVFANDPRLALLIVPSVVYHLMQCVVGGAVSSLLRRWRNTQYCRPGTTLLPLRYIRVPKHLTPTEKRQSAER